jgi:hypothetical protein
LYRTTNYEEGSCAQLRFEGVGDAGALVKDGVLTGAKIVESTLEKVPSASSADTASNANTVGGYMVRRFATAVAPNGPEATVLNLAYYIRANGTGVTVLYGWREDALGGTSACRVFGQAIGG